MGTGRRAIVALVLLAATAAAVGCGSSASSEPPTPSTAPTPTIDATPSPDMTDTTTDGAPPTTGSGSTVDLPSSARPVLTAGSPRAMAPPRDSPIWGVRRDCGMSTELSDGSSLWVFCDTIRLDAAGELEWFIEGSAAVVPADARARSRTAEVVELRDALDADGRPVALLAAPDDLPRCPAGTDQRFLWPTSTVAAPMDADRDRVLVYFAQVCVTDLVPESTGSGLAELVVTVPVDPTEPHRAEVVAADLFPAGEGFRMGQAAVREGEDLYVYGCRPGSEDCALARVPVADAARPSAYRWWDGSGWVPDAASAAELVVPEPGLVIKPSVAWMPDLGRFVWAGSTATGDVRIRMARRPEGPWSLPADVTLPECARAYPDNCFAAEVHPSLSSGDHVAVTYFDPRREGRDDPPTRVLDLTVVELGEAPAGPYPAPG